MLVRVIAKRVAISVFFILSSYYLYANFANSTEQVDKSTIENIGKHYSSIKDTTELKNFLKKKLSTSAIKENKSAAIIANVFMANKIASIKDLLNPSSSYLFKKALLEARKLKRSDLELWISLQYGYYLYTYREINNSFPYFMFCVNHLDKINEQNIIQAFDTYKKTAYFLTTVGDYEKATDYLEKARGYCENNSSEMGSITDALGLIKTQQNDLPEALKYFNETLLIAKSSNDELRYAKALGNIAEINFKQKKYVPAIALLNQDIAISKKTNSVQNTIYALILLGRVYLESGNIIEANNQLNFAKQYAQSKTYLKSSDYEINLLILEIAKKRQDDKEELTARRNLDKLKKPLNDLDGEDVITKIGWETEKNNLSLKLDAEKSKREKDSYIKTAAIILCAMLLIIIAFVIRIYRNRIKTEKGEYDNKILRLSLDKVKSEQKLSANSQTIESYKSYLTEKNNQIEALEFEMQKIKKSSAPYLDKYSDKIQLLLDSHLMNHDSWIDFKQSFARVYPEYYQFLMQNFNELTDSNLRIIFLTKLEMSNVETARILGLTVDAVKKAKQRLKKKYGVRYDSLFDEDLNR